MWREIFAVKQVLVLFPLGRILFLQEYAIISIPFSMAKFLLNWWKKKLLVSSMQLILWKSIQECCTMTGKCTKRGLGFMQETEVRSQLVVYVTQVTAVFWCDLIYCNQQCPQTLEIALGNYLIYMYSGFLGWYLERNKRKHRYHIQNVK